MSSRVGFRFLNSTRFAFRNASAPFRRPGAQGFRFSSTEAGADATKQSTFQRMWNSPVGVKTVHFWYDDCIRFPFDKRYAPSIVDENTGKKAILGAELWNTWSMKNARLIYISQWCLVIAGMADFARPAEKLSLTQNAALMGTGAIWTRWCMIIKPRNVLLAAVNFFLGCVGAVQVTRIFMWQRSQGAVANAAEGAAEKAEKKIAEKTA
ncbi:Serine hydrolase FSH [Penicillium atrosanguineum]|uniref:Serine hydrolase FSH n=1 Tax=Penicillium atrosanguineum TaxID=1132637 RepID=UPI0023870E9F|nr:Serine hydrolase FSH [Penicillium atrosanguineum]KAJ5298280.1 Serine hydrolase FSH [Penicillium atrosanguineum]